MSQARLWVQVIHELRSGVRLKKTEYTRTPIEFELTPYEILMDDIRAKRYKLNKVWSCIIGLRWGQFQIWPTIALLSGREFTWIPACNDLSYHCSALRSYQTGHSVSGSWDIASSWHSQVTTFVFVSLNYLQVMVEGRLPPKVKRDAHDVILEFIRSRPPLKPVRCEQRALFVTFSGHGRLPRAGFLSCKPKYYSRSFNILHRKKRDCIVSLFVLPTLIV